MSISLVKGLFVVSQAAKDVMKPDILTQVYRHNNEAKIAKLEGKLSLRKEYFIAFQEKIWNSLFEDPDVEVVSYTTVNALSKKDLDCSITGPRVFPEYNKHIVMDPALGIEYEVDTSPLPTIPSKEMENRLARTTKLVWGQDLKKLCGVFSADRDPEKVLRPRDESLLNRLHMVIEELKSRRLGRMNVDRQVLRPEEASSDRHEFLEEDRLIRQLDSIEVETTRLLTQLNTDVSNLSQRLDVHETMEGQMDTGKDMSIISDVSKQTTQSVELVDQAPRQTTSDPKDNGDNHTIKEEKMDTLEQMANRWFPIAEFPWQTQENGTSLYEANFPSAAFAQSDFFQSPNTAIFKNYRFFRFDVEFEIVVNSSKMQAGALLCSWRYLDQFQDLRVMADFDQYQLLTQGPHSFAFAGRNTIAKLVVPYKHFTPMLATTPGRPYDIVDFFRLKIHVYNYLRGSDNCNDPVTVNVFMRFLNLRKAGLFGADGARITMEGQFLEMDSERLAVKALTLAHLGVYLRTVDKKLFDDIIRRRYRRIMKMTGRLCTQEEAKMGAVMIHYPLNKGLILRVWDMLATGVKPLDEARRLIEDQSFLLECLGHLPHNLRDCYDRLSEKMVTYNEESIGFDAPMNTESGQVFVTNIIPLKFPDLEADFLKQFPEVTKKRALKLRPEEILDPEMCDFEAIMEGQMDLSGALKGALTGGLEGLLNQTNADNNRDRPSDPRTMPALIPYSAHSWANGEGTEITNILRLNPTSQTPHFSSGDEMQTKFVTEIFSAIDTFTYRTTDAEGALLASYAVHPIFPNKANQVVQTADTTTQKLATYRLPTIGSVAANFAYWKGSIQFRFDFIVPFSNTGRVMIAYIPTYRLNQSRGSIEEGISYKLAKSCYNTIFDLGEQTSITFDAPFYTDRAWLKTDPQIMESSGVLAIFVVNRLVRFCNSSSIVDINCFVRAGNDFELAVPIKPHISPSYQRFYIEPQTRYRTQNGPAFAGLGDPNTYQETIGGVMQGPVIARSGPSWSNWVIYRPNTGVDKGTVFVFSQNKSIRFTKNSGTVYNLRYGVPLLNVNGVLGDSAALALFETQEGAREFADYQVANNSFKGGPYIPYVYSGPNRDTDGPPSTIVGNTELDIVAEEMPGQMDDRQSQSILSSPGESTTHSSSSFYNEKFTDLKTLARRYQFYGDYETDVPADTCFGKVLCRVPVRPLIHVPPVNQGDRCALQMFNAVRSGFIANVGSGYRFFKGSLRFKIIFDIVYTDQSAKNEHDDLTFMITHVPNRRPEDYITTPEDSDLESFNPQGYAYYGHATRVNPICEIEIPYYSRLDYITPQTISPSSIFDPSQGEYDNLGYFDISLAGRLNKAVRLGVQIYYAFGDDARFSSFQGFPSMILVSEIPKSVTLQETTVMEGQGLVSKAVQEMLQSSDFKVSLGDNVQSTLQDLLQSADAISSKQVSSLSEEGIKLQSIFTQNVRGLIDEAIDKATESLTSVSNETVSDMSDILTQQQDRFFESSKEIVNSAFEKSMAVAETMGITINNMGQRWVERSINIVMAVGHIAVNTEFKTILLSLVQILNSLGMISAKFMMSMYEKLVSLGSKLMSSNVEVLPGQALIEGSEEYGLISTFASAVMAGIGGMIGIKNKRVLAYAKGGLHLFKDFSMASNHGQTWLKNNVTWLSRFFKWVNVFQNDLEFTDTIADNYKDLKDWLIETHNILQIPIHRIEADLNMVLKVYTLAWKAESFITMECKEREKLPIHYNVRHYSQEICKIRDQLLSSSFAPSIGVEPFLICLAGQPGFGKSELLGVVCDKLVTDVGFQTTGNTTYVRGFTSYWNNAGNQPGVVIDEVGMNEETTKQIVQEIFSMKSRSVFNPEFAHLEDKRRVFNPALIVMASNFKFWDVLPTGALNLEALHRRRDALWEVSPNFPIDPKSELSPYEQQVQQMRKKKNDFAASDKIDMDFSHLKFRLCINPEAKNESASKWYSWVTYEEFYKKNLEMFALHRRKEIKMVKAALDRFYRHRISYFSGMKDDDYFKSIRENLIDFKDKILNNPSAEAGALLGTYTDPSLAATVGRLNVGELGHNSALDEAFKIASQSMERYEHEDDDDDLVMEGQAKKGKDDHVKTMVITNRHRSRSRSNGSRQGNSSRSSSQQSRASRKRILPHQLIPETEWQPPIDDDDTIRMPPPIEIVTENSIPEEVEEIECKHKRLQNVTKPFYVLEQGIPHFFFEPFTANDRIQYSDCARCWFHTTEGKAWKKKWGDENILTPINKKRDFVHYSEIPPDFVVHFKNIEGEPPTVCFPALQTLEIAKRPSSDRMNSFWSKLGINWSQIKTVLKWFAFVTTALGSIWLVYKLFSKKRLSGYEAQFSDNEIIEAKNITDKDQFVKDKTQQLMKAIEDDPNFDINNGEHWYPKIREVYFGQSSEKEFPAHRSARVKKGANRLTYKVMSGQSSSENIRSIVQSNVGIARFVVDGREENSLSTHYTGLYGRVIVMVRHLVLTLQKLSRDGKSIVCYIERHGKKYEFNWGNIEADATLLTEVILVELPKEVPEFRDIRSHIGNESTVIPTTATITYLSGKTFCSKDVKIKKVTNDFAVSVEKLNDKFPCQKVLMYNFGFPGLCCAPVISNSATPKILGFHIAGVDKKGASQLIYREELPGQFSVPEDCFCDDKPQVSLPPNLEVIGILDRSVRPGFSTKTQLIPSLMYDEIFPSTKVPAPLSRTPDFDPLELALNKFEATPTGFDEADLKKAKADLIEDLIFQCKPVISPTYEGSVCTNSLLTIDQVFSGIPGLTGYKKLNLATSEGYPFCVIRNSAKIRQFFGEPKDKVLTGKHWLFDYDLTEDGYVLKDGINSFHPFLRIERERMFKQRMNPGCFEKKEEQYAVITLKDQKIAIEKALQGKNRIFSACPVEQSIAVREYFGHFKASYMENRINNSTAIGINVNSPEWGQLALNLLAKGNNIVTGDYTAFGDTLDNDCVCAAFESINAWYDYHYKSSRSDHENKIRVALYEEMKEMPHIARNVVFKRRNGIPSGFGLTVEINDLVNKLYMKLAWLAITKESLRRMKQHVYYCMYGDDMILSVTDQFKDVFNFETIRDFLQKHNIRFTPATKDERIYKTIPLDEATFLKGYFVQHQDFTIARPIMFCKLPLESTLEMLNWQWNTNDQVQFCFEACRTALQHLYPHGEKEFNYWRKKMFNFFVENSDIFGPDDIPHLQTFEELETQFLAQFS